MFKSPTNTFWGNTATNVDSLTHLVDVDTDVVNNEDFEKEDYVMTNAKDWERMLFKFQKIKDVIKMDESLFRNQDIDYLLEKIKFLEEKLEQLVNIKK